MLRRVDAQRISSSPPASDPTASSTRSKIVLEQPGRVSPALKSHPDDEQQVEEPRQPQTLGGDKQHERAGEPHGVLEASGDQEDDCGTREREPQ